MKSHALWPSILLFNLFERLYNKNGYITKVNVIGGKREDKMSQGITADINRFLVTISTLSIIFYIFYYLHYAINIYTFQAMFQGLKVPV